MIERILLYKNLVSYNLKIVFGNKFVFFMLAAIIFFLMVIGIMLFNSSNPSDYDIYNTILLPGFLIMFYPSIFNLQNDKDTRMLEIIFGLPNYKYKVYLVRYFISLLIMLLFVFFMSAFSYFAIVHFSILRMSLQLMVPLLLLSSFAFMLSTLMPNGNSVAVVLIIVGLAVFIFQDAIEFSKFNPFLNPFRTPYDMSNLVWESRIRQNRIMQLIGTAIFMIWAMGNMQNREKHV